MADDIKINRHLFHGFYSEKYLPLKFSPTRFFYKSMPLHSFKRAIFGAKRNVAEGENGAEDIGKPLEFQNEQDAFRWYKKYKLGAEFEKLEFPKDFCKNYFTIPESEFYKYKNFFHGMIKNTEINSEIKIEIEGKDIIGPTCNDSQSTFKPGAKPGDRSDTITFKSPTEKPAYFSAVGGADDIGYLNGKKITEGDAAASFDIKPKDLESELNFYAVDTLTVNVGISATVNWFLPVDYKQTVTHKINVNSSKIFDIDQLEKRIGTYYFIYDVFPDTVEDKIKEEFTTAYVSDKKIFKDNWEFDSDAFNSLFSFDNKKFNLNSTFLNDPVLLPVKKEFTNNISQEFNKNKDNKDTEEYEKQKNFTKKFDKLGEVNFSIKNENIICDKSKFNFQFSLDEVVFIKSEKKYMCFVNIDYEVSSNNNPALNACCKDTKVTSSSSSSSRGSPRILSINDFRDILNSAFIDDGDFNFGKNISLLETNCEEILKSDQLLFPKYLMTTKEVDPKQFPKYKESDCSEEKEIEFKKVNIKINLFNQEVQIECIETPKEYIFDNSNCDEESFSASSLPGFLQKQKKYKIKYNVEKPLNIKFVEWKKSDFDINNSFPFPSKKT
jgi:hypothetical protein